MQGLQGIEDQKLRILPVGANKGIVVEQGPMSSVDKESYRDMLRILQARPPKGFVDNANITPF